MNTLEDRLRAALNAKSGRITEAMLDRPMPALDPDTAPVLLLPEPPHRPHRSRGLVASALAVAAMLLLAFGAVVMHRASTPGTVGAAHIRPRSAVPWDQVGNGWSLQITKPGILDVPGGTADWLYLIDPDGQPYRICQVPDRAGFDTLPSWGRLYNTDRVILMQTVDGGRSSLLEIDLRTGAQHSVFVPGAWSTAEFVDAAGTAILLNKVNGMVKVDAGTGAVEATFAGSEFFGSLISTDRTQVISGGPADIAVRDLATGRVVRRLAAPHGYQACVPTSWLSGAIRFVARCQQLAGPKAFQRFEFTLDGSAAPVRPPVPEGWDEIQLADAGVAMKTPDPQRYEIAVMAFARVTPAGRLEPLVVPAELKQSGWSLESVTPAGFLVGHETADRIIDTAAVWNPLTGQVRYLFSKGGSAGSPRGYLAAWQTSQL